jgi:shikimate dehydrogenase|tara:strand:+ start:525 stop:1256 length:732 start_codon:yes stop_codon:yes gene_type:complete
MKKYGLIGYPLLHSFSKQFFKKKFLNENIDDTTYNNYELSDLNNFKFLIKKEKELKGLNVTIPYKKKIIPFLDEVDEIASKIGSVNVIKFYKGKLKGYNSDYLAFKDTLIDWLPSFNYKALILGSGGSSNAVVYALKELGIDFKIVSRKSSYNKISYNDLDYIQIQENRLIVNTTPLGMYPKVELFPNLDFNLINDENYVYDLIYNPEITVLQKKAQKKGAKIKNGLEMLYKQAEISWNLWNK